MLVDSKFIAYAFAIFIAGFLLFDEPMTAQQVNPALVVNACGAAPSPYPSSGRAPLVVDVNGNLCAGVSVSATIATTGLAISVSQGASSVGVPITPIGGVATSTAPNYTQGTINSLSFDLNGNLRTLATVSAAADQTVSTTNSKGSGAVAVVGAASSGNTAVGGPVEVAGASGTTVRTLIMNNQTPDSADYGLVTRNIPSGTQTVSVSNSPAVTISGTPTMLLATSTGTGTVGGIVINNAAGASAVNIQDGGNSITVDGTVSVGNTVNVNFLTTTLPVSIGAAVNVNFLTSSIAVTPASNSSINLNQITGATPPVASGALGVVLQNTSGNAGIVGGVNVAQMAGVAPVMASGVQAVVLAQTAGTGSIGVMTVTSGVNTGASVATVQPVYIGGNGQGNLYPVIACDLTVTISQASSGTTQLVALSSGKRIYICSYSLFAAGTVNVQLEDGTTAGAGTGCTAGTNRVTGNYNFIAQTGISKGAGLGVVARSAPSAALCIRTSQAVEVDGEIAYTQFGWDGLGLIALGIWRRRCLKKSLYF